MMFPKPMLVRLMLPGHLLTTLSSGMFSSSEVDPSKVPVERNQSCEFFLFLFFQRYYYFTRGLERSFFSCRKI